MNKTQAIELIKANLNGIQFTQTQSPLGWWETSTGAEFGKQKLDEIISIILNIDIFRSGDE